jgi:2-keto-3-deoxy-L-rhamnonate aldolase RhmA
MRDNPVKAKLAVGKPAFGTFVMEFASPGLMPILAAAGAEFVILDMEHSGFGLETIKQQIASARGVGILPFVRVPAAEYQFIARALDVGALGIMVPMVETKEQAKLIVASTRYPAKGRRGAAFNVAHDDYVPGSIVPKIKAANARTLVIAQIETDRGLENVDAIVGTDGVDVGWIGHFDLSNFLGIPAQFHSNRFLDARARVLEACRRHGKAGGVMAGDMTMAREWYEAGFTAIAYGSDIGLLQGPIAAGLGALREAAGARAKGG